MIPLEELSGSAFGQYECECLENGEFLPIKAGVASEIPVVPPQILLRCDDHYGLMDYVGFWEEPKEEPPEYVYFILSIKDYARLTKHYVLLKDIPERSVMRQCQEDRDRLSDKMLMEFQKVGYVAEITSTKKFIPHNPNIEVIPTITGLLEGHKEFSSDEDAVKWFLSELEV
jgi:hypothetical protein